jgi:hypothetical protein
VLVVQTQQPYSADRVRAALKAGRKTEQKKKVLYRFPLEQFEGSLWFADERTLVIGLMPVDLDDVPLKPSDDLDRLPAAVVNVLRERLTRGTQTWAVGHADDWSKTSAALVLPLLNKEDQAALAKTQTLAVWLQFDQGLGVNAAFRCKDEASAEAFDQYLGGKGNAIDRLLNLFGDRREAEAARKELAETLTRQRKGVWVDARARVGAAAVQQAFGPPRK